MFHVEVVLIPHYLVLIGELFVLGDVCQRGDFGVRKWRLIHTVTVERGVVGDEAYLGFLKDEGWAAV